MARILTTCPTTGQAVPTGHRTTDFELSEQEATRAFRCPSCQQVHSWNRDTAVAEETLTLGGLRQAAA